MCAAIYINKMSRRVASLLLNEFLSNTVNSTDPLVKAASDLAE